MAIAEAVATPVNDIAARMAAMRAKLDRVGDNVEARGKQIAAYFDVDTAMTARATPDSIRETLAKLKDSFQHADGTESPNTGRIPASKETVLT